MSQETHEKEMTFQDRLERVRELKAENPEIEFDMVGLNGNAFSLMGAFQKTARRGGWSKESIDEVLEHCQSGNYDQLISLLLETDAG